MKIVVKSMTLLVMLFLVLQYPAEALAQTTTTESSSTPSGTETQPTETETDAAPETEAPEDVEFGLPDLEDGSQSMMAGQDGSGNLTSVQGKPIVGHRSLGVDENSGALQYSYPLTVPPGRGNTTPLLSLDYTNQTASDQDIFGYGWNLSVPYIETVNKIGSERMYSATVDDNYFYSTLSGELVRIGATNSYRAKVENGDFLTYASSSNGWTVTDKVGNKYYFGSASSSRQDNASNTSQVARWMLAKVEDQNGNYATYTYTKNQNTIYPAAVTYSHGTSTTGIFEVRFVLATSTINFKSYDKSYHTIRAHRVSDVKVLVSGTEVRNYSLRYGTGANGHREMLLGITERGVENGSTTTIPEIVFGYQGEASPNSWSSGEYSNTFPEPLSSKDLGVRFGDLNGDGLTDVVRYYKDLDISTTSVQRVHLNRGHGNWTYNATWSWSDIDIPFSIAGTSVVSTSGKQYMDLGTRLIDVNGDGRDDLVVAYDGPTSSGGGYPASLPLEQIAVYLNTGVGFQKDTSWTGLTAMSEWNTTSGLVSNAASSFVDVNGDGLPDIVYAAYHSDTQGSPYANTTSTVRINNGNGWTLDTNRIFPATFGFKTDTNGYRHFNDTGTRVADVNGDGLPDVIRAFVKKSGESHPNYDEGNVYLNTGSGWASSSAWTSPVHFAELTGGTAINIVDINGDRLPDLLRSHDADSNGSPELRNLYISTGQSWLSVGHSGSYVLTTGSYDAAQNKGAALLDFDGDTLVDVLKLDFTDQHGTHATGGSAYINGVGIPDNLNSIRLPQGGLLSMALDGFLNATVGTYGNVGTSTFNPVIATKLSYSSAFGNQWSTDYRYHKPDFYYASSSIRDRRYAGFGEVLKIDDFATTTTFYHQGNGNATTSEELADNVPKIGFPYRTEVRDAAGDLFKIAVSKYATSSLGDGAHFVKLERQTVLDYDGDSDHRDTATEYAYSDSTGEVTTLTEWGRVTANTDGTFSDSGSDKRTTTYSYAASSSAGIHAMLSQQTTRDQSSATTSATRYLYDNRAFGSVDDGNLTKREHWVATSSYIDYEWTYNGYGLPLTEKDPRDKTTTHVYDSFNLYPATTTNPLSQSTTYTYDYSSGKPKTVTDPNNLTQTFVYDGLDRITEEKVPDPTTGASSTKTTYTYHDAVGTSSVLMKTYRTSTSSTDTYTYLDGFGRQVQTRTNAEASGDFIARDLKYGIGGLLYQESLPYFSSSSAKTSPRIYSSLYTTYTYDALARIAAVGTAIGSTITSRDQWTEIVTDALGNQKDYEYDAFGRLITVTEHNGTSSYETAYEWDRNSNLIKITDALDNVRNITYDGLSRRLTLEDLHDPGDASFGTWSFAYDQSGNLISKTDPKNQTVEYTYDNTNRPLTENYTGQTGTEATYTYDSCTRGIGRVCTVGSNSATTTYTYAYNGLAATTSRTIATTTYNTVQTYDRLGNQTLVKYPDNSEVAYTYNSGNQLETVTQRESGGAWQDIIEDLDYGPHGQVTYQKHGNGTETTKTYDPNELYRLRTIYTTASTSGMGGAGPEHATLEAELEALGALPLLETPTDTSATTTTAEAIAVEEGPTIKPEPEVAGTATSTSESDGTTAASSATTTAAESPEIANTTATSTATSTPETTAEVASSTATSTDTTTTIEFGLSSSTASSTDLIDTLIPEVAVTTEPVATTTLEIPIEPVDTELTDQLITNIHEARVWQQFHQERVAGLEVSKDAPPEALEKARYAKDRFDSYLLQKEYTQEKGGPITGQAKGIIERFLKTAAEAILSAILPERAYAYLFGIEDFEDCSSLPCSFSNTAGWGSVTQSLDATSKVEGVDSLKEVVTGEGSAVLESINHNEDEIWVQFKVYIPSSMAWGGSGYFSVLRLEDSSNGAIFWMSIEDWGTPRLTFDGDTLPWTDSGITLTEGAVNTIEVRFKKSATVGDVDIWHDTTAEGSPDYNGSGSMNTGTDNVDDVQVGMQYAPETGISTTYYDDIAIDSTFIGEFEEEPTEPFDPVLQDYTYIYDAVGNITHMLDESSASSSVMYAYQYDDLYRLTAFGTSTATITTTGVVEEHQVIALQPGSEGKDTFYGTAALTGPNGDYPYMYAGGLSDSNYTSYIEFDQSSLAHFDSIATATLKLFVLEAYSNNNAKLQRVTSSWTESGVTSSNVPSFTDIGMAWQPAQNATWWTVDVTDTVTDWHDGTYPNYGFKILAQNFGPYSRIFHTSDHETAALHPILEVSGVTEHVQWDVSASSTFTPIETYSYNALGNILTKSDVGAYEYGGDASNEVTLPIYTDSLASGWADNSWSMQNNAANTSPVHAGTYSLRASYTAPWAGLALRHSSVTSAPYDELHLAVNVGTSTSANLYAYFTDDEWTALEVVDLEDYVVGDFEADTWHELEIPLSDLGFDGYSGATTFVVEASATSTIYVDDIVLVGASGTPSYANPHAATVVNGVSQAYDTNGNLVSAGSLQNTWSYDNRLTQSAGVGISTTTYAYDASGQRVTKTSNGVTTRYPSNLYEVKGASTTKHIYAGDALIATVDGTGTYHNHLDHLGSTNAVTNSSAHLNQELRYYPFGSTRVSEQYGALNQSNQFTGHDFDPETDQTYMGARYYGGTTGRFVSQDPLSLSLGDTVKLEQVHNRSLDTILRNPQRFNTYAYAGNNPMIHVDSNGEDYYYFNSGVMEQRGTGNQMYFEVFDQQMLNENAGYMENNLLNGTRFAQLSQTGGDWDYKQTDRSYFFDGELYDSQQYGNLHYGYVGTAAGFGENILKDMGGFIQVNQCKPNDCRAFFSNARYNYDLPEDSRLIQQGVESYKKNGSGSSKATAGATNQVYTKSQLGKLVKAVSSLTLAVKKLTDTLKSKSNSKK